MARASKKTKKRDHKKEYARRIARALALGYSKSVARGHARHEIGEVGLAELRQMQRAAKVLSPGEQRRAGVKRPVSSKLRRTTRERVAEIAGVDLPRNWRDGSRRSFDAETFVDTFVSMGLGTRNEGFTLWFSP